MKTCVPLAEWLTIFDYETGGHFGTIDIVAANFRQNLKMDNWYDHRDQFYRISTIISKEETELLSLQL